MAESAASGSGRVVGLHVSDGGVPKHAVARAVVRPGGIEGDRQRDLRYHGGPERAVSLFSREVMDRLRAEGHPIAPGTTGENVLLAGLDWRHVQPGARLRFEDMVDESIVHELQKNGFIDKVYKQ